MKKFQEKILEMKKFQENQKNRQIHRFPRKLKIFQEDFKNMRKIQEKFRNERISRKLKKFQGNPKNGSLIFTKNKC